MLFYNKKYCLPSFVITCRELVENDIIFHNNTIIIVRKFIEFHPEEQLGISLVAMAPIVKHLMLHIFYWRHITFWLMDIYITVFVNCLNSFTLVYSMLSNISDTPKTFNAVEFRRQIDTIRVLAVGELVREIKSLRESKYFCLN